MADVKRYLDEIPPENGRTYQIVSDGSTTTANIADITDYDQEGSTFGAKDIIETGILECEYAYSEGVHLLTNPNETVENIRFFATTRYSEGDTFSVNGVTVTAINANGSQLWDGAFNANTVVQACYRGGILYFTGISSILSIEEKARFDNLNTLRFGRAIFSQVAVNNSTFTTYTQTISDIPSGAVVHIVGTTFYSTTATSIFFQNSSTLKATVDNDSHVATISVSVKSTSSTVKNAWLIVNYVIVG